MFTEKSLRDNAHLVKALMGIAAEDFYQMLAQIEQRLPLYEQHRLQRETRQRAMGGGRNFGLSLTIRVALVLSYLRLHVPQTVVAVLYGCKQWDVSRELRRLLPLVEQVLPCPEVWQSVAGEEGVPAEFCLELEQFSTGRVLIDATEQRILRPSEQETQKEYYSGKKKMHTLKTQIVADAEHHIVAISEAVPGKKHDKKLSDELQTMERLPNGVEVRLDSGYQGVDKQVGTKDASQAETGSTETEPRLTVLLPFKKPRGGELTDEQKAFNRAISQVRVRIEHCIGWVKNWAIIATRFRCAHSIYTSILRTVCGLVNAQTLRWQQAKAANCA